MRLIWVSSRPEENECEQFADSIVSFSKTLSWNPARFELNRDWAQERALLSSAKSLDGLLISGMSLTELESMFQLRALQLIEGEGRLDIPAIILVRPGGEPVALPRFGRRMQGGWPFRSALFIGDAPTVEFLRNEGLSAIAASDAKHSRLRDLFDRAKRAPRGAANQSIAVQIQPMWLYSGSTTPFSNQIGALLDQGFFVLRIFIDSDARLGPTLRRRLERLYPEATMDAAPHVEVFACPDGDYEPLDRSPADEAYRALVRSRMSATTDDELVARLAARAGVAIVNYAVNLAFAVRVCPAARIVLETHDYVTRQTIERSRHSQDTQGFPSCSSIRRHVELEHLLWRAADVCVSLSLSELAKMRRYCAASAYVLSRPYTRRSSDPAANARWDIVIVANPHPLNVQSVEWFLAEVICKSEILTGLRIAIVGRIREDLEDLWRGKLPSVHWLGYIRDIEELRDQARLSVCPDQAGTGVSIKALTAMAAEHPIVATRTALRGMGDKVFDLIPVADTAEEMKRQIVSLLDDEELLKKRRGQVSGAYHELRQQAGHEKVLSSLSENIEDRSWDRCELLKSLQVEPRPIDKSIRFDKHGISLRFGVDGNATAFLGHGWHWGEAGGRWTDGRSAKLRLPAAWVALRCMVEISFVQDHRAFRLDLKCEGKSIRVVSRKRNMIRFDLNLAGDRPSDTAVELEIAVSSAFCPLDEGLSDDRRVLGVFVKSLKISRAPLGERLMRAITRREGPGLLCWTNLRLG